MATNNGLDRRALLKGATATAVGTALGATALPQVAAATGLLNPGARNRIDVHCHLIPDFYRQTLADSGITTAGGIPLPAWSPRAAIQFMNNFGIQAQVVSISEPGVGFLPTPAARAALAKKINDYISTDLVRSSDAKLTKRFGGFAVLPIGDPRNPQDIENAINEARRAINVLKLDGVSLFSSYNGVYLGDSAFDNLMLTLNLMGATVLVHPVTPKSYPDLGLPTFLYEFPFDTARAAVNMSYKLIPTRYPLIKFILAHAGGALPFLAYRTSLLQYVTPALQNVGLQQLHRHAIDYRRYYYDTALSPAPSAMMAVKEVTYVSHIMFATDWPFAGQVFAIPGDPAPQLEESFSPVELVKVHRDNALTRFPRLRARLA